MRSSPICATRHDSRLDGIVGPEGKSDLVGLLRKLIAGSTKATASRPTTLRNDAVHTTSSAFLDALTEVGVSYIFANFGSDHPALIETIAEARATGRPTPEVIICPNEMAGLSAAHGFWQVSGIAQAVLVHVECGTQALAGAVHNAAKGRAPVLIFAGASPITQHGELKGAATNSSNGCRTSMTRAGWCAAI